MRKTQFAALLTAATMLWGCEAPPPAHLSVVEGASFRDSSRLTVTIADILAASLVPATTTVSVRPVAGPDPMRISLLLDDTLRERGFALAPGGMDYPGAHNVRYSISLVDGDVELVLDVDSANATCVFGHDAEGALVQVGSCSVLSSPDLTLKIPVNAMPASSAPIAKGVPLNIAPPATPAAPLALPSARPVAPPHPILTPIAPTARPAPPLPTWTLVEGQPIRDQMLAWGDRAGWRVFWPRDMNWMVPVTTSLTGAFAGDDGVVSQVIRIVASQGKPIKVRFYTSNHSVLVTSSGQQ